MGRRIAQARHEAGYKSAEALPRDIGVSGSAVRKWEADEHSPRRKHLERIAELTDKPIGWFYGDDATEVSDTLRQMRQLLESNEMTRLERDGSARAATITDLPQVTAGQTDGGVIAVPTHLLPDQADVPHDHLVACYADETAIDLAEDDVVIADSDIDVGSLPDGAAVIAVVDGQVVVREAYAAAEGLRLLIGRGGTSARVPETAIVGRVLRALSVRTYGDTDR